jgi:Fe-S-cluster containining protein
MTKTKFLGCLNCREFQQTCCTLGVSLTIDDIKRIESLGYKLEDFVEPGQWYKYEIEGTEHWWINSMTKVGKKLLKLQVKDHDDEKCFFLEDGKGCVLGDKRPWHCKVYPFWVEKGKVVYDDLEDKFCCLNRKKVPIKQGLKLINEAEIDLKRYYSKIKQDCIKNKQKHKKLILKLLA